MEEEIKKFLDEMYRKYKNITDEDGKLKREMNTTIYDFLYDNRSKIDNLPTTDIKAIETYAIKLSNQFDDKWVGFAFLHSVTFAL